jgi:hypothetical protein
MTRYLRAAVVTVGLILTTLALGGAPDDDAGIVPGRMSFADNDLLLSTTIPLDKREEASRALQKVIEAKGLASMDELSRATDPMVSLHARWECVKGKPAETDKFLKAFKRSLRVEPPKWWRELLAGVKVREGNCHSVPGVDSSGLKTRSRLLTRRLEIRADPGDAGSSFRIQVLNRGDEKVVWSGEVWAAGRTMLGGVGVHQVEMLVSDDRLFVFGAESHGIYAECFRLDDGKPLLRFCTCYWFNFSEKWKLK